MKLINETRYDTRELRGLACLAYRTLAKVEGRARWWPRLRITVKYGRGSCGTGGYAYFNGGPVRITVPRAGRPLQSWTILPDGTRVQHILAAPHRARVLWVLMHELMHCYGYRHTQFTDPVVPAFPNPGAGLTVTPPRATPVRDVVTERKERASQLLALWEHKLKCASTKVRVYRRRVRYYEQRRPVQPAVA